jgi:hypothetical protein
VVNDSKMGLYFLRQDERHGLHPNVQGMAEQALKMDFTKGNPLFAQSLRTAYSKLGRYQNVVSAYLPEMGLGSQVQIL